MDLEFDLFGEDTPSNINVLDAPSSVSDADNTLINATEEYSSPDLKLGSFDFDEDIFGKEVSIDSGEDIQIISPEILSMDDEFFQGISTDLQSAAQTKASGGWSFNRKFFISYLGINPLVILKESPDILTGLIRKYTNKGLINKLYVNIYGNYQDRQLMKDRTKDKKHLPVVEGFHEYMMNMFRVYSGNTDLCAQLGIPVPSRLWTDEQIDLATEIVSKFQSNWEVMMDIMKLINLKYSNISLSSQIDDLFKDTKDNTKDVLTLATSARNTNLYLRHLAVNYDKDLIAHTVSTYKLLKDTVVMIREGDKKDKFTRTKNPMRDQTTSKSRNKQFIQNSQDVMQGLAQIVGAAPVIQHTRERETSFQSDVFSSANAMSGIQPSTLPALDNLTKILSSKSIAGNKTDKTKTEVDYWERDYRYTPAELEILKDLGFPVSLAGNEHYIKYKVNLSATNYNETIYKTLVDNTPQFMACILSMDELTAEQSKFGMSYTVLPF